MYGPQGDIFHLLLLCKTRKSSAKNRPAQYPPPPPLDGVEKERDWVNTIKAAYNKDAQIPALQKKYNSLRKRMVYITMPTLFTYRSPYG